jgi:RES domain-containing protein
MAQPLRESLIRVASTTYADQKKLVTGVGSFRAGARWNPPGMRVVYLGFTMETALAEYCGNLTSQFGLPSSDLLPATVAEVRVSLDRVLDLTEGAVRNRLKVSLQTMKTTNWVSIQTGGGEAVTQALGRAAMSLGLGGLVFPSVRDPNGRCLACFCDNVPDDAVTISNVGRLPPGLARPADPPHASGTT